MDLGTIMGVTENVNQALKRLESVFNNQSKEINYGIEKDLIDTIATLRSTHNILNSICIERTKNILAIKDNSMAYKEDKDKVD